MMVNGEGYAVYTHDELHSINSVMGDPLLSKPANLMVNHELIAVKLLGLLVWISINPHCLAMIVFQPNIQIDQAESGMQIVFLESNTDQPEQHIIFFCRCVALLIDSPCCVWQKTKVPLRKCPKRRHKQLCP